MENSKYITNKEKEMLNAIIGYIEQHQYAPSVREIGQMVGLKSTSSVHNRLKNMIDKGMIETDGVVGTPRAIRVPGYKFSKIESDGD